MLDQQQTLITVNEQPIEFDMANKLLLGPSFLNAQEDAIVVPASTKSNKNEPNIRENSGRYNSNNSSRRNSNNSKLDVSSISNASSNGVLSNGAASSNGGTLNMI